VIGKAHEVFESQKSEKSEHSETPISLNLVLFLRPAFSFKEEAGYAKQGGRPGPYPCAPYQNDFKSSLRHSGAGCHCFALNSSSLFTFRPSLTNHRFSF
jgi:hypothetical protein